VSLAPPRSRIAAAFDHVLAKWLALPRAVRLLAPVTVMTVWWWASSQPVSPRPASVLRALAHNGMHIVGFSTLAICFQLGLGRAHRRPGDASVLGGALALTVAYGIVDELHQSYVPGRVCSVSDILSDACGGAFGLACMLALTDRVRLPLGRIVALFLCCCASVALATFGPW
jgi:VanZ family protein